MSKQLYKAQVCTENGTVITESKCLYTSYNFAFSAADAMHEEAHKLLNNMHWRAGGLKSIVKEV